MTRSEHGLSDHSVVDIIREAKVGPAAATQSTTSLIPRPRRRAGQGVYPEPAELADRPRPTRTTRRPAPISSASGWGVTERPAGAQAGTISPTGTSTNIRSSPNGSGASGSTRAWSSTARKATARWSSLPAKRMAPFPSGSVPGGSDLISGSALSQIGVGAPVQCTCTEAESTNGVCLRHGVTTHHESNDVHRATTEKRSGGQGVLPEAPGQRRVPLAGADRGRGVGLGKGRHDWGSSREAPSTNRLTSAFATIRSLTGSLRFDIARWIAGFTTTSPVRRPKSCSIAALTLGDDRLIAAHEAAAEATMALMEKEAAPGFGGRDE